MLMHPHTDIQATLTRRDKDAILSKAPKDMIAKRFNASGVMIVLLAIGLVGGGCATTSSQTASAPKPHKPQMITADGVEEVGGFKLPGELGHGFKLSDDWAAALTVMGPALQILGQLLACH